MELRYAEENGRLRVSFCGDLDNASVPEAEKALENVLKRDDCDILLDCSHLNYISSKGLRLLIEIYKHFRNCEHRTYITKMNEIVREVLYIGGFLEYYQEIDE